MTTVLPAPNLDDRGFQELVDDGRRLMRSRFPEWSDHNLSDPGITLIEAFAAMLDQLIYRLNRVPDRHYLKFLDLIGLELRPASAARAQATFWLSAPQPQTVTVRAEAEVSTDRTDLQEPVVFATLTGLDIVPCTRNRVAVSAGDADPVDRTVDLDRGGFDCFGSRPAAGDCLLIGLSSAVPSCAVLLRLECRVSGVGVDPLRPPLVWEAWTPHGWVGCEVDRDETGGFNKPGDVVLHLPSDHSASVVAGQRAGWVRCRVVAPLPDQPMYSRSPHVDAIAAMTVGGTAPIAHARAIRDEVLGVSDGSAAQRFPLRLGPVVPGAEPGTLTATAADGAVSEWTAVDDFAESGPESPVFHVDAVSGEIAFGPAVREADGSVRNYGAAPPKGAVLQLHSYRVGGGTRGNIGVGQIRVLKTSVPYVARVENRIAAVGGAQAETVEELKARGPVVLRSRGRAVTTEDFEQLTREAAPEIARVHCLGEESGLVRVLVVPHVADDEAGRVRITDLAPLPETLRHIAKFLDRRRLIGTRVIVEPPEYIGVTVAVGLTALTGSDEASVKADVSRRLCGLLHPLRGGQGGTGWPFGRSLRVHEVNSLLASVPGVDMAGEITVHMFPTDPHTGQRGDATDRILVPDNGLICSYRHSVLVQ